MLALRPLSLSMLRRSPRSVGCLSAAGWNPGNRRAKSSQSFQQDSKERHNEYPAMAAAFGILVEVVVEAGSPSGTSGATPAVFSAQHLTASRIQCSNCVWVPIEGRASHVSTSTATAADISPRSRLVVAQKESGCSARGQPKSVLLQYGAGRFKYRHICIRFWLNKAF